MWQQLILIVVVVVVVVVIVVVVIMTWQTWRPTDSCRELTLHIRQLFNRNQQLEVKPPSVVSTTKNTLPIKYANNNNNNLPNFIKKTLCWFPAKYFKLLQTSKKRPIKDHTILLFTTAKINVHPKEEGAWLGFTTISICKICKMQETKKRKKGTLFLVVMNLSKNLVLLGPHRCQNPPVHLISFLSQHNWMLIIEWW